MINTLIQLLYIDANNDKSSVDVVFEGVITNNQIQNIQDSLVDGEKIIAYQIGLPTPSQSFVERDDFPSNLDHVWTTMRQFGSRIVSVQDLLTNQQPTTKTKLSDFIKRIKNVEWDVDEEMLRLGF